MKDAVNIIKAFTETTFGMVILFSVVISLGLIVHELVTSTMRLLHF